MGQRLKTKLPTSAQLLKPQLYEDVHNSIKERQLKQKQYFDRGARQLPLLMEGEKVRVRVKDHWQPAVVVGRHNNPRSLIVETADGNTYRRNRRHLLKTREMTFPQTRSVDMEGVYPVNSTPAETDRPMPSPTQSPLHSPATTPLKETVTPTVNRDEPVKRSRCGRPIRPPKRYSQG